MLRKADLQLMIIILVHPDVHICFAEHIRHLPAVIQKALFHPVNIPAQLRKFRAALNVYDLVKIPVSNGMELLIDTVDVIYHIMVHITGHGTHKHHGNYNKTGKKDKSIKKDQLIKHPAGKNTPNIIGIKCLEYTERILAVDRSMKAL